MRNVVTRTMAWCAVYAALLLAAAGSGQATLAPMWSALERALGWMASVMARPVVVLATTSPQGLLDAIHPWLLATVAVALGAWTALVLWPLTMASARRPAAVPVRRRDGEGDVARPSVTFDHGRAPAAARVIDLAPPRSRSDQAPAVQRSDRAA